MNIVGPTDEAGFTIGICASDSAETLPSLLSFLASESFGGFDLRKILVVASGCSPSSLARVETMASSNDKIRLMVEQERFGKAEAINRILSASSGEYVVMLNSDAFPYAGSILELLRTAEASKAGAVSAMPIVDTGDGLLHDSLFLMWTAHSLFSLRLNHAGISNHACDELIAFRRSLVPALPANLVNDGAYIGGLVRAKGYPVKFSTVAKVKITVPLRVADMVRQRRRIIFGHFQVWRKLGHPPQTMESMLLISPLTSMRAFVGAASKKPTLVAGIPILVAGETFAFILGALDVVRRTEMHGVWRRNGE